MRGVPITLDRPRLLRFNITAARRFKQEYGKALYEVRIPSENRLELLDHDCLAHILYAGLRHEDSKLNVDKVVALLDDWLEQGGNLKEVYDKIGEAFKTSGLFGDADTEGKDGGQEAAS